MFLTWQLEKKAQECESSERGCAKLFFYFIFQTLRGLEEAVAIGLLWFSLLSV